MNKWEKAKILGAAGSYDSCGPKMCEVNIKEGLGGIYHAQAEHKDCRIFKTLMDNRCTFDCKYCANAAGCKKKPASYEPEELAQVFTFLEKNLKVDGLFLSSAITGNPDQVSEKMLDAVRLLRNKYHFRGYVHFKVLPGTSYDLIKQAAELSNRMSINVEAPNKQVLSELSTNKDFKIDILRRQAWISKMNLRSGQTTQMIINNLATDKDVLKMVNWEYENIKLKRMYFSAFKPVKGTALEKEAPETNLRETHLYNVDFLIRQYEFKVKEFNPILDNGMLPREDPKLALAKANFDSHIDINQASYQELIRIPGIGPTTAQRILNSKTKIKKYEDLHKLGGWVKRAKPFIEVGGKRQQMLNAYYQKA